MVGEKGNDCCLLKVLNSAVSASALLGGLSGSRAVPFLGFVPSSIRCGGGQSGALTLTLVTGSYQGGVSTEILKIEIGENLL